jgi:hypothetical protein
MGSGWMNGFIGSSPVITTNNYYIIADIHNLQPLHTNLLSLFPLVFTVNKSSNHTLILLLIYDDSVLQFNLQSDLNPSYRLSLYRHGTDHIENSLHCYVTPLLGHHVIAT